MLHEFFMDGDTLMVSMHCDASSVVTRPATEEEAAAYVTPDAPEPQPEPEPEPPSKAAKK